MATVRSAIPTEERTDTRTNIKVAARRLFAERGLEAVTVREIVAAAGARNGGSLNYYFKSKEGLVLELISEIFSDLSDIWLERLSDLDKQGGPTSVRDIVNIIIRGPNAEAYTDPSPTAHRFLANALYMRRKELSDYLDEMNFRIFRRMLQLIARLRSDIPEPVMRQRLIFFAWYIISVQATLEAWRASRKNSEVWAEPDPLLHLVDTATALIEAGYPSNSEPVPAARPAKRTARSPGRVADTVP